MKLSIKYKILTLFIILILIVISLFTFYSYFLLKEQKKSEIYIELKNVSSKVNNLLFNYHKKIINKKNSMDPQSYLDIVRELSLLAKEVNMVSIKSIMKENEKYFIIATSATDKEFKAESYQNYFDSFEENLKIINRLYSSDLNEIYNKNRLFTFVSNKNFLLLISMDENYVKKAYDNIFDEVLKVFLIALGVSLILSLIAFFILNKITKQISLIDETLVKFFNYINRDGKKEDVKYIKVISKDELGDLSIMINKNIEEIISKLEKDKFNTSKDSELIENLIEVLTPSTKGVFKGEAKVSGYNKRLNDLRDIVNETIPNMSEVLLSSNQTLQSHIDNNYITSIEAKSYQSPTLDLIEKLNKLSEKVSAHLLKRANQSIKLYNEAVFVDDFIENSGFILEDILINIKDIVNKLETDLKFATKFENSVKALKMENRYINSLINNFGYKYEQSLKLIDDLDKKRIISVAEFTNRFNYVISDSSVRDSETQNELINKIKEITSCSDMREISQENTEELLKLLTDELLKDIRYSLFIFDENIDKLTKDIASKVSTFYSVKNISEEIKEIVMQEINHNTKAKKISSDISQLINEIKIETIEDNNFIGKEDIINTKSQKRGINV